MATKDRAQVAKRQRAYAVRKIQRGNAEALLSGYSDLLRSVLDGDADALNTIGTFLTYGIGVERMPLLARACYVAAARCGSVGALYNLASVLIGSQDGHQSIADGLKLMRRARRRGSPEAAEYLGYCYLKGIGVGIDAKRAFRLFREAAEAGVASAMNSLGRCYALGLGTAADAKLGRQWTANAARHGDAAALRLLARRRRAAARQVDRD
jgi:uncharacterized protein